MSAGNPANRRVFMIELIADTSTLVEGMEIVVMQLDDVLKSISQVGSALGTLGGVFDRVGPTIGEHAQSVATAISGGFIGIQEGFKTLLEPLQSIATRMGALIFSINSQTTRMEKGFSNLSRKIQGTTNVIKGAETSVKSLTEEVIKSHTAVTQLASSHEKGFQKMGNSASRFGRGFVVTAGDLYRSYAKLSRMLKGMVEEAAGLQFVMESSLPAFQRMTEDVGAYAESLTHSIFPAAELMKATAALGRAGVTGGKELQSLGEHALMMGTLLGKSAAESTAFVADLARALQLSGDQARSMTTAAAALHTKLNVSTEALMQSAKASLASAQALGVTRKNAMALGGAFEKMGASAGGAAQMLGNLMGRATSFDQQWKLSALSGMGAQDFVKSLKSNDPLAAIQGVSSRLLSMSEFQRTQYLKNILGFSEEEALVWSNIAKHPDKFAAHLAESNRVMKESQGLTAMFAERTATLQHQWSMFNNELGNIQIRLASGITPVLTALTSVLRALLGVISYIPTPLLAVVGIILSGVAGVTSLVLSIAGLVNVFSKLGSMVNSAKIILGKFIGVKVVEKAAMEANKTVVMENVTVMGLFRKSVGQAARMLWDFITVQLKELVLQQWYVTSYRAHIFWVSLRTKVTGLARLAQEWYNRSVIRSAIVSGIATIKKAAETVALGAHLVVVGVAAVATGLYTAVMESSIVTAIRAGAVWLYNTAILIGKSIALGAVSVATGAYNAAMWIAEAATWAWNAALYANPIGLVILGVVALIAVIYLLWDPIKKVFGAYIDYLVTLYSTLWSVIKAVMEIGYLFFLVSNPIGWTIALFVYFQAAVIAAMDAVYAAFKFVGQALYAVFVAPVYNLIALFQMVGKAVWDSLGVAFDAVREVVDAVYSVVSSLFSSIESGVKAALKPLQKLKAAFDWIGESAKAVTGKLFGSGFLHILEGTSEAIPSLFGLSNAFVGVAAAAANTSSKVASVSSSAMAAAEGIGHLAAMTDKLQGATVRGISVVRQVVADVSSEGSPIAAGAAAALRGAVVSPAAMMPSSAPGVGGGGGGGAEISITVPLMIDGEQIAMAVARVSREDLMRYHGRPGSAMRGVPS